jgi:hypothetical protein
VKLVRLVGFIKNKFVTMVGHMNVKNPQSNFYTFTTQLYEYVIKTTTNISLSEKKNLSFRGRAVEVVCLLGYCLVLVGA